MSKNCKLKYPESGPHEYPCCAGCGVCSTCNPDHPFEECHRKFYPVSAEKGIPSQLAWHDRPDREWLYKCLDDKFTALKGPYTCSKGYSDHDERKCVDCRLSTIESTINSLLELAQEIANIGESK